MCFKSYYFTTFSLLEQSCTYKKTPEALQRRFWSYLVIALSCAHKPILLLQLFGTCEVFTGVCFMPWFA